MELNFNDLDWKSLLIKKYKNYDLNEEDCMVLFVTDAILSILPDTLITKDVLSPYMVNQEEIDSSLSSLMSKNIISIQTNGNSFHTSIDGFKQRLFNDAIKDLNLHSQNHKNQTSSDSIYQEAEQIANRTLTPIERDRITSWLKDGADEKMIIEALKKTITKSGNISIKNADKLILEMERSESRKTLGTSTINENTKRNEELSDILNMDWTYHENK